MYHLARYEHANRLAWQILNAARHVNRIMGPGYPQEQYRHGISTMLTQQRLTVEQLFPVDVWQASELAALYFLDLFVEYEAIIEVRATRRRFSIQDRQLMAEYLEASGAAVGMLVNFGRQVLEYELIFPGA